MWYILYEDKAYVTHSELPNIQLHHKLILSIDNNVEK